MPIRQRLFGRVFLYERTKLISNNFTVDASAYTPFAAFPDLLTMAELQDALGVGRSSAYKMIAKGEIRYFHIGTAIKIPKAALISYVEENLEMCYDKTCNGFANQAVRKGLM